MLRWLPAAFLLLTLLPQTARAQQPACFADGPSHLAVATVGRTDAQGRLYFRSTPHGPPMKAYLVAGNEVVTDAKMEGFVCAWFKPKRGPVQYGTVGWLPLDALQPAPAAPVPSPADWAGTWERDRGEYTAAEITLRPAAGGKLAVSGNAVYSAGPDAVKRGAVNEGDLDLQVRVQGRLAGDFLSHPAKPDDDSECSIGLARVGEWLLAEDNGSCGGLNVSFSGLYRRK